jgi:hypothetical protein
MGKKSKASLALYLKKKKKRQQQGLNCFVATEMIILVATSTSLHFFFRNGCLQNSQNIDERC